MDPGTHEMLQALVRAREWLERQREAGWPPLSEEYLAHIARVEALPQNQSGADKSWVAKAARDDRAHFARVHGQR